MAKAQRAFWLFMAMLFLVTSLAFSGLVIYSMHQQSEKNKEAQGAQKAIADAQAKDQATKPKEGKLEGTKLSGFTPQTAPVTELQKIDQTVGTGAEAKEGDSITAHYTGALVKDGTIFQSSLDTGQPFTAKLDKGGLIDGWIQGIPGMKAGGKRRLVIPAALAYGSQAKGNIPANSDLVFDIELIKVGQ